MLYRQQLQFDRVRFVIHPEEKKPMTDDFIKQFEAIKTLVTYK